MKTQEILEGRVLAYQNPRLIRIIKDIKRQKKELLEAEEELRNITNKQRKRRKINFINSLKECIGWLLLDCCEYKEGLYFYRSLPWKNCAECKYVGIGRALMEMGYYVDAKRILKKGLKRFPESSYLWIILGFLHYRLDHNFEALKYFETALKFEPKNRNAFYGKALSLNSLGCYEEAAEILINLIERWPDNHEYLLQMGYSLSVQGYDEDAISFYKRAKDKGYLSPNLYDGLYCTYMNLGLEEAALEMAEEGLREFPDVPFMYANLCEGYFEKGWIDEARNVLQQGLKKFPFDESIKEILEKIEDETDDSDKGKKPPIIGLLLFLSLIQKKLRR